MEQSEVFGVSKRYIVEYVDFQKKLRKIIENLTVDKALEIGISRREFFYLKNKIHYSKPIKVKEKILEKLIGSFHSTQ